MLTVPGTISANTDAAYADAVATQARALQGYWLWVENAVPVALLLHGGIRTDAGWALDAEVQPGVMISVNSDPSRAAILGSGRLGYHFGPLMPGARVQVVAQSAPLQDDECAQLSAAVFLHLDLRGAFFRVEYAMNLVDPYGIGEQNASVWGGIHRRRCSLLSGAVRVWTRRGAVRRAEEEVHARFT